MFYDLGYYLNGNQGIYTETFFSSHLTGSLLSMDNNELLNNMSKKLNTCNSMEFS